MANQKHSMTALKRAIDEVADRGRKVIDKRTKLGRELMRWRDQILTDLGGAEQLSTQQICIVDICVRQKMLLDSLDSWLLRLPSIVDKRRRQLIPAVGQRQVLADGLARYLGTLGLARVAKQVPRLSDYLTGC
jgi:hypothetical protein